MVGAVLSEYHPFASAESRERYLAHYDEQAASWPLASETRMVDAMHGRTLVRVSGPSDAPPLVLLNGVWTHSLQWASSMIKSFSEKYRTHTLDNLYDLGRSVSALPAKGTGDHMAWLDELFDALGLSGGINIMGISRGAWLSAEYVLHAPHRIAKSIWLSPALVAQRASLQNAANGPRSLAVFVRPTPRTVGAMLRWLMPEWERFDRAGFEQYVAEVTLGLQCFAKIPNAMGPRVFSDSELGGIRTPILYIAGQDEKLCSVKAAAARLASVAPQVQRAVFPDAGHALITVQEQAVSDMVLKFLAA